MMQIKNIKVKTLRILRGLNGHAGSNTVNPPRSVLFCVFSSFCSYFLG